MIPDLAARGALEATAYLPALSSTYAAEVWPWPQLAPNQLRRPAVFLDRDGVLNFDRGYVHAPHQVEWVPGAKAAVKLVNDSAATTHSSSPTRPASPKEFTRKRRSDLHRWMADELAAEGAWIDDWRPCPRPSRRKRHRLSRGASMAQAGSRHAPRPFRGWPIELKGSFLSATRERRRGGQSAGMPDYLFRGGDRRLSYRSAVLCGEPRASPASGRALI